MPTYLVDFELSLYHTERIEAANADEARAKCDELLVSDGFWEHLLECYDDPLQTDWLPENVTVSVYGEADDTEPSRGHAAVKSPHPLPCDPAHSQRYGRD